MTQQERPSPLRSWLARYKPDRIRLTLRSGEQRDIPKPSTTRGQWAQLEHAIVSLAPTYIEAFRGTECVASRAPDGEDDADVVDDVDPNQKFADAMAAATNAYIKTLPVIVQLVVDAGDASALRHQDSYKLAFESQLQLVKILSDRLGGLERAWHKMILDRAADTGGDGNDSAAMSLIGNIINKNGGSNGTASGKTDD
jgi:hypothetical protein